MHYEYTVDGRRHTSRRWCFAYRTYYWPGRPQAVADRYPVGAEVSVRYDPRRPRRAVLEAGVPEPSAPVILLAVSVLISVLGVVLIRV